jgi:hypothetical protein
MITLPRKCLFVWGKGYPHCGLFASEKTAVSRWFGAAHGKSATEWFQLETDDFACRYGKLTSLPFT